MSAAEGEDVRTRRGRNVFFSAGRVAVPNAKSLFVAKVDALGNHVYSNQTGQIVGQLIGGVAIDTTDAAVITGAMQGNIDFGYMSIDVERISR